MRKKMKVIGLGAGDFEQLTIGAFRTLKNAEKLFLRTEEHPVVSRFQEEGIKYQSFDEIYEQYDQFSEVYEEIVERLLKEAQDHSIVYAVPGDPLVAEKTVQLLLEKAPSYQIHVEIGSGQSFIDSLFTAVKKDPIEGFQLLDGTDLHRRDINIRQHLLIGQVYDTFIASNVKLTLMEKYDDAYPVTIITAAGSSDEKIQQVPLYEIDRQITLSNLTSLYVPPVTEFKHTFKEFATLREVIATLRGPNGCPWDRKQTHASLKKYLIEEVYELLAAIDDEDIDHMIEELGDVLLQVMLHAQIGEDDGLFTIDDVIEAISAKMVRRHPHVFGNTVVETVEEVVSNWEEIKKKEQSQHPNTTTILEQVEDGQPALMRAYELQKIAAKVGFDWERAEVAFEKVEEEMQEFLHALKNENKKKQTEEFGDFLFAMINVGRLAGIHPEEALIMTNKKFYDRFSYVEQKVQASNLPWSEFSLAELDNIWNEAKNTGL